ncbi:MAG: AAA family ATPase [Deltaproteobacteria bacterium]|jgi:hypothetical protein|nr:AAA family ATPase [Deltaproteobacteria bacterium]
MSVSLPELLAGGRFYADKSAFIAGFLDQKTGRPLLARPSGFGKSLWLDLLEGYWLRNRKLFRGLSFQELPAQAHPVLRLDLGREDLAYADPYGLEFRLYEEIRLAAGKYQIPLKALTPARLQGLEAVLSALEAAVTVLSAQTGLKPVILLDRSDAPAAGAILDPVLFAAVQVSLHFFLEGLSELAENRSLEMVFLTSETSFLLPLGRQPADPAASRLLENIGGLTEEEVRTWLKTESTRPPTTSPPPGKKRPPLKKPDVLLEEIRAFGGGWFFGSSREFFSPALTAAFLETGRPAPGRLPEAGFGLAETLTGRDPDQYLDFRPGPAGPEVLENSRPFSPSPQLLFLETGFLTAVQKDGQTDFRFPNQTAGQFFQKMQDNVRRKLKA